MADFKDLTVPKVPRGATPARIAKAFNVLATIFNGLIYNKQITRISQDAYRIGDPSGLTLLSLHLGLPGGGEPGVLFLFDDIANAYAGFYSRSQVFHLTAANGNDTIIGQGNIVLSGTSSGAITIQSQADAGTYNFNLPITPGTAGDVLTSQGGGSSAMTWTTPGTGTVTTVSIVTANGFSGSVANPTTTPAITLTLTGVDGGSP